jgi:hypothetical protein
MPGRLGTKARCTIAAGRDLTVDRVTIACRLDRMEIEAIIHRAVIEFDLKVLVEINGERARN